jgi:ribosomal protein S18 acetylase RimI-like enzyme
MGVSIAVAADPQLQQAALRVLYSRLPSGAREAQLAETLAAVARNDFSLDDLLLAEAGGQIVGAVLAVRRAGGAAFLWPPVVHDGPFAAEAARELLAAAGRRADEQGTVFMQCLLDPTDLAGREVLEQGNVPYVTDLILLSRSLKAELPPRAVTDLSVETWSSAANSRFAALVASTYAGTLDCPVLASRRTGEESLESHRATGTFHPRAWRIYRREGAETGVLLLSEHADRNVWEVAYLGVVPGARGQGIGKAILCDGLTLAAESGGKAMEIAADAGNAPALRLYRAVGFVEQRRYAVHLRLRG